MPAADQSHPFATFPATAGKGLRPYYTPGLTTDNYTTFAGQMTTPVPYYASEHDDFIDQRAAARELVNYAVLKYLTTAMSCPFEVSKTLLQVQYMPHEDVEVVATKSSDDQEEFRHEADEVRSCRNTMHCLFYYYLSSNPER